MYWTVLCYHPYLVSMLFADLLSLHLVTFLMFSYSCIIFCVLMFVGRSFYSVVKCMHVVAKHTIWQTSHSLLQLWVHRSPLCVRAKQSIQFEIFSITPCIKFSFSFWRVDTSLLTCPHTVYHTTHKHPHHDDGRVVTEEEGGSVDEGTNHLPVE